MLLYDGWAYTMPVRLGYTESYTINAGEIRKVTRCIPVQFWCLFACVGKGVGDSDSNSDGNGVGKGRYTFPFQFACPIQFAFRSIRHPPSTHSIRITAFPITLSVCPPHTTSHGGPLKPPDTAQGPGCHTGYQQNEPENTSCLRAWLHDTMTTRYKMRLPIRGYTLRLAYTISEVSKSVSESVS